MKARKRSKRKPTENSFERIPKGLKKLLQWVLWKIITINGKRTKIPYNPKKRNQKAKVNDPSTWGSYEEAVEQSKEGCDGIGFVVTEADDYIFLDLDACREAVTGKIAEWAMVIVLLLNSYTEESPSGCGIRIVIKATFPPDEKRAFRTIRPKVEETYGGRNPEIMAAHDCHYFTMTGRVIGGVSNQIEDRSVEFLQLYDERFREKPVSKKRKPKRKVRAVKKNEIVASLDKCIEKHPDRSTADFQFCCEAIRKGWKKETVWNAVRHKSKFATDGRKYFDLTWKKAAKEDGSTQVATIIKCIDALAPEYFHNPGENPDGYVSVSVDGRRENFRLKSGIAEQLLRRLYFDKTDSAASSAAIDAAVATLDARATFKGSEHEVAIRVARIGNAIFVDLADKKRGAVKITSEGREIVEDPPVKFIHPKGMLALPTPKRSGDINALRPFLNIANDDDWILLVSVIVQIFFPPGPFVIPIVTGEHGTAKSTLCKVMIALTDPKTVPLFSAPRNLEDVYVAACNSHVLCFNNMSTISASLSDIFCAMVMPSEGAGGRKFYTNLEQFLVSATRPIVLNGIGDFINRADLLDRSIPLMLPQISASKRRNEADFWKEFNKVKPSILGAIFDLLSEALRELPNVKLKTMPRMADFARLGAAISKKLCGDPDRFMRALNANRAEIDLTAIERSPVAMALIGMMAKLREWKGTATELLAALKKRVKTQKSGSSIRDSLNPNRLVLILRQFSPYLQNMGIEITHRREGHKSKKIIEIKNRNYIARIARERKNKKNEEES